MTNTVGFKKVVASGLATLVLAASAVTLTPAVASAQWHHDHDWGPGVAAGVIGGLAAGALAAGAAGAYGPYYGPGPYYYGPPAYPYPYEDCYFAPRRVWTGYRWIIRRVEVCD